MKRYLLSILIILLCGSTLSIFALETQAQESATFEGQIAWIGQDGNIWVMTGDDGKSQPITNDATDQLQYRSPRWSPDGTLLGYCQQVSGDPNNGRLFAARAGEWQPILLANSIYCNDLVVGSLDWSPDGSKIIFARPFRTTSPEEQPGAGLWQKADGVWMVDLTTGKTSEVIPPPNGNPLLAPGWSPDGKWIKAYEMAYLEGFGFLRTGNNENGALYSILNSTGSVWPGASDWSPDGTRLVFDEVTYTGYPGASIYTSNPDGSGLQKIYSDPTQVARNPLWSTDGSAIAFQLASYNGSTAGIALVASDGSTVVEIFRSPGLVVPVAWSPSGNQFIFAHQSEGQTNIHLYDRGSNSHTLLTSAGALASDWSIIPEDTQPTGERSVRTIKNIPYADGLLLYVTPDYRLVIYDAVKDTNIELTNPLTVTGFWPSPTGKHLMYSRHLMELEFAENGDLNLIDVPLPAASADELVRWAPDEKHVAFQDSRGRIWIANLEGRVVEIPGATSIPTWSADGSALSYCTADEALWVIDTSAAPVQIAEGVTCDAIWSPTQNLLAYSASPMGPISDADVYVYDLERGKSHLQYENASVISWSADGNLLALSRQAKDAEAESYILIVTDPDQDKSLEIGEIHLDDPGTNSWTISEDGYLFGPYLINADLSSSTKVADAIFDASDLGSQLLAANREIDLYVIACLNTATWESSRLLTVDMSDIQPQDLPGIWGWISPDGSLAVTRSYIDGNFVNTLHRCDGSVAENLPWSDLPESITFSEDNQWLVAQLSRADGSNQIIVYDLVSNQFTTLPGVMGGNAKLLRSLRSQQAIYSIEGRVTDQEGEPLPSASIFLGEILVTTSDENGAYRITRLPPGTYSVLPQYPDVTFAPASQEITVPPDSDGIDFRISNAEVVPSEPPEPTRSTETGDTPEPAPPEPEPEITWLDRFLEAVFLVSSIFKSPLALLACCGLFVLGLPILLILLIRRARRKKAKSIIVETPPTISDAELPAQVETKAETQTVSILAEESSPEPAVEEQVPESPPPSAPTPTTLETEIEPPIPSIPEEESQEESISPSSAELQDWLHQGMDNVRKGELDQGRQLLRQVLQHKPQDAVAWLWLGYVSARKGDSRTAERCFKLAKQFGHPKADDALTWLHEQIS